MSFCKSVGLAGASESGPVKYILLVASVFVALSSATILYGGFLLQSEANLAGVSSVGGSYSIVIGLSVYHIFLASVGALGVIFRCHKSLKTVALLAGLNVIFIFLVGAHVLPGLSEGSDRILATLERTQAYFDWDYGPSGFSESGDLRIRNDTRLWTETQRSFQCCGFHKFNDWNAYELFEENLLDVFPSSCCPQHGVTEIEGRNFCLNNGGLYRSACKERILGLTGLTLHLVGGLVWLNLIVFLAANAVIHCKLQVDVDFDQKKSLPV